MANLRTPLYDWHVGRGARMVPFGGWDMPVQYTGVVAEHNATRTACGLYDISHMGRLTFTGPDALALIQHVWTNDAATMKPGQVRYGLLCNEAGGVIDDVLVYRLEPFWLMVVNASNRPKVVEWLTRHAAGRDVTIADRTAEWAMIAVQGPKAIETSPIAADLRYYFADLRPVPDADGIQITSRTGYTGEDGYELILPAEQVEEFCFFLTEKQVVGRFDFPVEPCGLGARDTLRLEAAMPLYGHELEADIDPYQAGLAWAVKPDKGDFVGRDALNRLRADATRPVRVGVRLNGRRAAREGCPVRAGGREVGRVTSGAFTPTLQAAIGMAYVEPAFAALGTPLDIDIRGSLEPATVVGLPFYKRPKG